MANKIKYTDSNGRTPDTEGAINDLRAAYEENNAKAIASALEVVKATLNEANRIARRDFYLSKITEDIVETRKAIITAGYIDQVKLVNRVKKEGDREIKIDSATVQVDILEVNELTRKDIFSDHIEYYAKDCRDALVAYSSEESGKDAEYLETVLGYKSVKYLANKKTSMNGMRDLLQSAVDEIIFIDNGEGKNELLMKKSDVRDLIKWLTTKGAKYSVKYGSTATAVRMIEDILWARINDRELSMKMDDKEF